MDTDGGPYSAITLRDYFAAQVVAGLASDHELVIGDEAGNRRVAEIAYGLADALLKARKS